MRDRSVLVTGGTGALGGAVVDAFLAAGWRVVVTWVVPAERERMGEREGLELIEADLFHERLLHKWPTRPRAIENRHRQ